ncbi:hypothetical protein [Paenibacillus sp. YN15]|uniref:hypothetical protein n=1 Tax=Paenibacillus sp. YN15 TaxID=1742774 RepID=UPI000DCBFF23|nr:hypothetical protein [Paenibacillus sp. YN15]RAV00954.1 hypothetical protein DQG13_13200 [Paenibacillus sp. YN15]
MTEYLQHQQRLEHVLTSVNEAIHELNQAREEAAKAQASADPEDRQHAWAKLEQAERRAAEAKTQLLSEPNHSQEQQILQNLQELEDAISSSRQY